MNPMIEGEESKPARPLAKEDERPVSRQPPSKLAKSKDASKTKVTFYLDASTAAKLGVAAIIRRVDQSDIANEVLSKRSWL